MSNHDVALGILNRTLKKMERDLEEKKRENKAQYEVGVYTISSLKHSIGLLKAAERYMCDQCQGSGVVLEYDELDRYYTHVCAKCEGTGEMPSEQS